MAKNSRKKTEDKAYELARDIVARQLNVRELENVVTEHGHTDPKFRKLMAIPYPNYEKISKAFTKACPGEFHDLHWQEVNAYSFASFHLGFAAAMRLAMSESRGKEVNRD